MSQIKKIDERTPEELELILAAPGQPAVVQYPTWEAEVLASPEPPWLIERIVPSSGLTVITGWPKLSKKSWLAMAIAYAVATGRSAFGLKPAGAYPVLYAYMDPDVPHDVVTRSQKLRKGMGISNEDLGTNMHWWFLDPFSVTDPRDAEWLWAYVVTHGIKLVVLDTFNQVFPSDENNAEKIRVATRNITELVRLGCACIWVHHTTKGKYNVDGGTPRPGRDIRGSGAIEGALTQHLGVRAYDNDPDQYYLAAHGKRYQDWYKYEWNIPEGDAAAVLRLEKCEQPNVEPEDEDFKMRGRAQDADYQYTKKEGLR